MDLSKSLSKWVTALEARQVSSSDLDNEWVLQNCDWRRKQSAIQSSDPDHEARLARYKRYFDELDVGVSTPRWDQ
jgi:hypothetical protein